MEIQQLLIIDQNNIIHLIKKILCYENGQLFYSIMDPKLIKQFRVKKFFNFFMSFKKHFQLIFCQSSIKIS